MKWILGCALLITLAAASAAQAEVIKILEAENGKVTCAAGNAPAETIWASNGKVTPAFWGRQQGDEIQWTIDVPTPAPAPPPPARATAPATAPLNDIAIIVRYSYAAAQYQQAHGAISVRRILKLTIDNDPPIDVKVPDTGWWDLFQTTTPISLANIAKGRHTVRLTSPEPHACTNVDCLILYRGKPEIVPAALRSTTIGASESKRFVLRATPNAAMKMAAPAIFREFDRIFEHYEKFIGWSPPTPVAINLIEDGRWPNPGATSFQNGGGVFFRAGVMDREQGNFCHEMVHMFYVAHFPWWFDESTVRTLTLYDFGPALYEKFKLTPHNAMYRQWSAAAKDLLAHPEKRVDDVDVIHAAIRTQYGPEIFRKFFRACLEAGKRGELDFTSGRHLTRDEIVKYMSKAAGEDVTPLYRQWNGFDKAE